MSGKLLSSVIFIRLMVGAVFLSEGIQKFIFPDELGAGRFLKIGLPWPGFFGYFVPVFEVTCGALILLGLFTRHASIPLIIIILTAIISTKIPLLINEGFWKMAHEARTDWSMLLGLIFLLIAGSGKFSLDNILSKTHQKLSKGVRNYERH
ncbi:MAG: DoxX family protein [Ignavibacteria bacterium]